MKIKELKFNKYGNNIIIYRDNVTGKWITNEEYHKLLKENVLHPRLKNLRAITSEDAYYIFFKDEIDKLTKYEQLKIKGV